MEAMEEIKKLTPDREKALNWMKNFDEAKWEAETHRCFGSVAPGIIEAAAKEKRNARSLSTANRSAPS